MSQVRGNGRLYEVSFLANVRDVASQGLNRGSVSLGINRWTDYFAIRHVLQICESSYQALHDFRASSITVRSGRSYHIRVFPTTHVTTADFRGMSLKNRGCRYPDEMPADRPTIFKRYTQKSCMFECVLKAAMEQVHGELLDAT